MGDIKTKGLDTSDYNGSVSHVGVLHASQYFTATQYKIVFYILGTLGLSIFFASLASQITSKVSRSISQVGCTSLQAISSEGVSQILPELNVLANNSTQPKQHTQGSSVSVESKTEDGVTNTEVTFVNYASDDEDTEADESTTHVVTPVNGHQTSFIVDNTRDSDGRTTTTSRNILSTNSYNRTQSSNNSTRTTSSTSTRLSTSTLSRSTSN